MDRQVVQIKAELIDRVNDMNTDQMRKVLYRLVEHQTIHVYDAITSSEGSIIKDFFLKTHNINIPANVVTFILSSVFMDKMKVPAINHFREYVRKEYNSQPMTLVACRNAVGAITSAYVDQYDDVISELESLFPEKSEKHSKKVLTNFL